MPTSVRIALLAGLLALASNIAIIGFIQYRTYDESASTLRRQVVLQTAFLNDVYRSGGMKALDDAIDDTLDPDDPLTAAGVINSRGEALYGNVESVSPGEGPLSEGYRTTLLRLQDEATPHIAGVYLRQLRHGDWLVSARTAGEGLALRQTLQRSLLVGLALSLLLGIACGVVVARYVGRRVRSIAAVADRIGSGDLGQRVPVTGTRDPFERLARQINAMLDRITQLMGELQMVTDALAHDLRSPVGRLRAAAEGALDARSGQDREQLLAKIIQESDSLTRILTTVLEIGRSEAFASRNQFALFDAGDLVAELFDMYDPVAEEAGAALSLDRPAEDVPLLGHRQLLAQALSNLVENAINYGASGERIELFLRRGNGHLDIGVADCGPGIPADQRAEARRRFARLDSSRTTAGAGLGLTLAQAIAHLHGGELVIGDAHPGLVATLHLPLTSGT